MFQCPREYKINGLSKYHRRKKRKHRILLKDVFSRIKIIKSMREQKWFSWSWIVKECALISQYLEKTLPLLPYILASDNIFVHRSSRLALFGSVKFADFFFCNHCHFFSVDHLLFSGKILANLASPVLHICGPRNIAQERRSFAVPDLMSACTWAAMF